MDEDGRGVDRASRRSKRFLTPLQKYEIWLALLRQEVTTAEAAATHRVDRSTVVRIREVAKLGALAALSESRPGAGYPPVTGTQHRTSLTGHFLLLLLSSD